MEQAAVIIGIIGLVLSLASLMVMLFGINLGKNALLKGEILFGKEAEDRYNAIKHKLPRSYSDSKWEGGHRIIPQFRLERHYYQGQTSDDALKGINKILRYFYKDENGIPMVKTWHFK